MAINFTCSHCGQAFSLDESLAGKHGHCKHCGKEMLVPSAAATAAATKAERRSYSGDDEDDGTPYELDADFEPPPSAVSPPSPPIAVMEARAGWRHTVRVIRGKLAKFEDAIYMVLMLFWLIGAVAFLFELKPLAWTMLGLLVILSVLLLILGGFDLFVQPFQESLRHGLAFVLIPPYAIYYVATRWEAMKKPFRKALGAFGPLLVLLALAFLSRPIRDWYLHPKPKDEFGAPATSWHQGPGTPDAFGLLET
ncbi:hypothetical protein [Aquisphaera insulae]|uniref:hypothetical protein n=1 Tax=Aquisphaera insulae TaxID=2712864 RepID=UPI0013EA9D63|nr:hypothetical protein [Aquisphaera insulae]